MSDNQIGAMSTVKAGEDAGAVEMNYPVKAKDLPFDVPDKNAAQVGLSVGGSYNMGNFNNAKLSVSITVPCKVDEVEIAYKFCKDWADGKVMELVTELFSGGNNGA